MFIPKITIIQKFVDTVSIIQKFVDTVSIIQKFVDTIFIQIGRKKCGHFYIFDQHSYFFYAGRMRKSNSNLHLTLGCVESCGRSV